jgi:hypothetical protein
MLEIHNPGTLPVTVVATARPVTERAALKDWIDGRLVFFYQDSEQFILQGYPPVIMTAKHQVITILSGIIPVSRAPVGLLPHEPIVIVCNCTIPVIQKPQFESEVKITLCSDEIL